MVSVRRAVPGDVEQLLELIAEFYAIDRHDFDAERVVGALGPLLDDDAHGQVWLVHLDDSGNPADGYGVITWGYSLESGGRDALVDELYVRTRGNGVGAAALRQMLASASAAGARRAFLETERHNDRVRSFYARLGFAEDDSVWMSRNLATDDRARGGGGIDGSMGHERGAT